MKRLVSIPIVVILTLSILFSTGCTINKITKKIVDYDMRNNNEIMLVLELLPTPSTNPNKQYVVYAKGESIISDNITMIGKDVGKLNYYPLHVTGSSVIKMINDVDNKRLLNIKNAQYAYDKFVFDHTKDMLKGAVGIGISYDKYQALLKKEAELQSALVEAQSQPEYRLPSTDDINNFIRPYMSIVVEEY